MFVQDTRSQLHVYNFDVVQVECWNAMHEFISTKQTLHDGVDQFDGAILEFILSSCIYTVEPLGSPCRLAEAISRSSCLQTRKGRCLFTLPRAFSTFSLSIIQIQDA